MNTYRVTYIGPRNNMATKKVEAETADQARTMIPRDAKILLRVRDVEGRSV